MRTTLSLDDDVARLLEYQMRDSGKSLKETVNHFLRQGLMGAKRPIRKKLSVTPRPLGLPPGLSYNSVEEVIEHLEGVMHK